MADDTTSGIESISIVMATVNYTVAIFVYLIHSILNMDCFKKYVVGA